MPGSTYECAIDLGPFFPCDNPYVATGLPDGEHILEVRARSPLGILDTTPEEWSWDVEQGLPETTIVSGPKQPTTTSTAAAFVFSSDEPAEFECSLDGMVFEGCEEGPVMPGSADRRPPGHRAEPGQHTLRVRAVDEAGFFDPTPATLHVDDRAAAQDPYRLRPGRPDLGDERLDRVRLDQRLAPSSYECRLDAGAYQACTSPVSYTGLAIGWHAVYVRAIDADGHVDISPAIHGWTIQAPAETEPPDTIITLAPPLRTSSTSATFRFSASELGTTFKCSLDNEPFTPCAPRTTYTELAVGDHNFRVQATDAAGNVELEPASHSWTIFVGDETPPETYISSAPPVLTTSESSTFMFAATESRRHLPVLDRPAARGSACSSPKTYTGLAPGDHLFLVRATDPSGNVDPSPGIYEWTVEDLTPPTTHLVEMPADPTESTTARFGFVGHDNATIVEGEFVPLMFQCRLDSQSEGAWTECTSPQMYFDLAPGRHTFEVRAVDEAGNVDASPSTYSWTIVDTTPPDTTIDSGPLSPTQSTSAILTFSSNEAGSTFECSLDGAAFAPCTSPKQYTGLWRSASHELQVRATDRAGHVDATPASYAWTVSPPPDTTPPNTTIDTGPPAETPSPDATLTFSSSELGSTFQCSLDGSAFNSCVSPARRTPAWRSACTSSASAPSTRPATPT